MRLVTQEYAVFLHAREAGAVSDTWNRIFNGWLGKHGFESAHKPDFEVYGPGCDPIRNAGDLELWVSVKPGSGVNPGPQSD